MSILTEEDAMKRLHRFAAAMALTTFAIGLTNSAGAQSSSQWTTIFDGKSLDNFNTIGDANWRIEDGSLVADKGNGFVVTKNNYGDFEMRVEFWADEDANSGIYIRCADPQKILATNCYEVNIFDKRPQPIYGTGAIVDLAKVDPMPKAGGKWNVFEITAKGPRMSVVLNGQTTVDGAEDTKFATGPFALQFAPGVVKDKGVIKFRKVELRPL